uniref:Uncharacterized protein n=1 Tax=Strigamia maritima TaxID=126957 RepID=T1ILX9_STRMM
MISQLQQRIYTVHPTSLKNGIRRTRSSWLKKIKNPSKVGFRTLRFFLCFLSILVCAWQVSVCLNRHFKEPISTIVVMEYNIDNYTFPTIVVCPNEFIDKVISQLKMEEMNTFSLESWKNNELHSSVIKQKCSEAVNTDCVAKNLSGIPIDTVEGHCYKYVNSNVYRFTGTDFWQTELIFPGMNVTSSAQIYTSSKSVYKYNLQNLKLTPNALNFLFFRMTEVILSDGGLAVKHQGFQNKNTNRNPCWSEDRVINCLNLCMDNILRRSNITCMLPFLTTDLPFCSTWENISTFYRTNLNKAYMERHTCDCKRPCKSVTYTTFVKGSSDFKLITRKTICMFVGTPEIVVIEVLSYPLSSLTADVLSNVGFFLGISMLTVFDFILQTFKVVGICIKKMSTLKNVHKI